MSPHDSDIPSDQLAERLWQELVRAPHDRHHDWRTPILATQGLADSGPQARAVVLRHADAKLWRLRVYTDARSPKCAELAAQPLAQLTFWSKRLNWQLRASAVGAMDDHSDEVKTVWERVRQSRAAADYLSPLPPGHQQSATEPEATQHDDAMRNHHLAILNFKVTAIDWLALRKEGHCRARLTPDGVVEWLAP